MRRFFQQLTLPSVFVAGILAIHSAGQAAPLYSHSGSTAPSNEGFSKIELRHDYTNTDTTDNITEGPVANDNGTAAWNINDSQTSATSTGATATNPAGNRLFYHADPDATLGTAAQTQGFTIRTRLRVVNTNDAPDFGIYTVYSSKELNKSFGMQFGSDANGNAVVGLYSGGTITAGGAISYDADKLHTIAGGSVYHTYELTRAANGTFTLLVDGVSKSVGNYAGYGATTLSRFQWGANQSNQTGNANYNLVQFEIVPEPSGLALLGLGLAGLLARRRG